MGIFNFLKKKKSEPSEPPTPNENINAPMEFPGDENLPPPPTEEAQNEVKQDSFPNEQENLQDMPSPPQFESFENKDSGLDKPFNPEVPSMDNSSNFNTQQEFNQSSDLPNPFDSPSEEKKDDFFGKKMPTFAEKFGTTPENQNNEENQEVQQEEPQVQEPNEETHEEQPTEEHEDHHEEEHDHEEFKFSNNEKKISKSELPLEDVSEKINTEVHTSVEQPKEEKIEMKEEIKEEPKKPIVEKTVEKEEKIYKKSHPEGTSFYLSTDACNSINYKLGDIKDLVDHSHEVQKRLLDLEKKSDSEYLNWKKNIDSMNSSLLSIDKKLFR